MKTHKSIYETPLVLVEAFSTELGFAQSAGSKINAWVEDGDSYSIDFN